MRNLIVSGRVVADAELKTTTDGGEYISFRLVNHEYDKRGADDKKEDTYWFSVTASSSFKNIAPYLKKGKLINIVGRYTDSIWARNDGTNEISRNLRALDIAFVEGSKEGESKSTPTTTTAPPQVTASTVAGDDGDELPF
ncbi:MAG: single-stranded DNA-binding protein [Bacteroidales bacterium]|nr:single-stranded DNA-binding protein [Bacteroidales bacterium]